MLCWNLRLRGWWCEADCQISAFVICAGRFVREDSSSPNLWFGVWLLAEWSYRFPRQGYRKSPDEPTWRTIKFSAGVSPCRTSCIWASKTPEPSGSQANACVCIHTRSLVVDARHLSAGFPTGIYSGREGWWQGKQSDIAIFLISLSFLVISCWNNFHSFDLLSKIRNNWSNQSNQTYHKHKQRKYPWYF